MDREVYFVNTKEGVEKRYGFSQNNKIRSEIKKVTAIHNNIYFFHKESNLCSHILAFWMQYWEVFSKNSSYCITKDEYLRVNVKIAKCLCPNFDRDEAARIAEVCLIIYHQTI
jgi:hypothetical protein